jgi:hypothetical protein
LFFLITNTLSKANVPINPNKEQMKNLDLKEIKERALKIRKQYHQLEKTHHGSEWTVEEDTRPR